MLSIWTLFDLLEEEKALADDRGHDVSGEVGDKMIVVESWYPVMLHRRAVDSGDSTWLTFECLLLLLGDDGQYTRDDDGVYISSGRDGVELSQ
eukprot:3938309-Rhodomonas_salina.1